MNKTFCILAVSAALSGLAFAQKSPENKLTAPKAVPAFSVAGTDGKTHSEKSLTSRPTLLVFLNSSCPHNVGAATDLNKISSMLKGKVAVIGMVNLPLKEAKAYSSKLKLNFPLVADGSMKVIKKMGARHSLDMALISSTDKKVVGFWEGYSRAIVAELDGLLPKAGAKSGTLRASVFNRERASGCGFQW
jgi:peroxiredoxin